MSYPPFHPLGSDHPLALEAAEFAEKFPGEGQNLEFKQSFSNDRAQAAMVAFSNASGGVLLLGVADNGQIVGTQFDGEQEAAIHRAARGAHNVAGVSVHQLIVESKTVVAVSVPVSTRGLAQTSGGVPLVRRGAMNVPLIGQELAALIRSRTLERFELTPTAAHLSDADPSLWRQLADAFGWSDLSPDRLVDHEFAIPVGSEHVLTVAGALYLLEDPCKAVGKAKIEILRFREEGLDYDRRVEVMGPLNLQVEQATAAIAAELGTELVVIGLRRHDLPRIPTRVIREAVANAVAHRAYELTGSPVRVEIRPAEVTITSPGGLSGQMTIDNLRESHFARNERVMEALRRFGLAEDIGRGVDVMEDTMAEHLLDPPEFAVPGDAVQVAFRLGSTVTADERAWIEEVTSRGGIEPRDRLVLVYASRGDILTNSVVRDLLGIDSVEARQVLQRLRDADFLVQEGERGAARYFLAEDLSSPAGLALNLQQLGDLVVGLAANGPIRNADVRKATGLDRISTLRLLSTLTDEGQLERRGEKRGTHYVLVAHEDVGESPSSQSDTPPML